MPTSITAALLAQDGGGGSTPLDEKLFHAAVRGDSTGCLALLRAGAQPDGFCDRYGTMALHAAARSGNLGLCAALIEAGADVNHASSLGGTPLGEAVRKVHPEVVRLLVESGARLDVTDRWGRLPVEEILCGGPTTAAECEIRSLLLGSESANVIDKTRRLEEMRASIRRATERQYTLDAAHSAFKIEQAAAAEAEAHAQYQRSVIARHQARPHAWMAGARRGTVHAEQIHMDETTKVNRVRRERREELQRLQMEQALGYRLSGTSGEAPRATIREALSGRVVASPQTRVEAAKQAAWRAAFNPLLGCARPDCERPMNQARWNRKESCWEMPIVQSAGLILREQDMEEKGDHSGPTRASVESLSGFERLVLSEIQDTTE